MKKRVFIIHGWGGSPEDDWFPWLKKELEQKGFEVFAPAMPNTEEPKIEEWVSFLANLVGESDENTYFVGHSIGRQAIMRYMERFDGIKVGGIVFVAGWFNLANLESEEEEKIARPWVETPINLEKIKNSSKKIAAIFSDNDPVVPLNDNEIFKKELGAGIIVERNKGHFNASDGVIELPVALEKILEMSS
ncbi:alpha/beta hydrolase [Patescibacteria group bacterium]|nr:alpha/beta hydrolase [Patescibacteria group bacterium]MBU4353235.1 alpha/beta hydrolase [Patescibacteria group bacterium]MBU4477131.1 alpha/beta hydrolase [Patescibacteria group bacterium]MCG2698940.1 alpha/beta hydrolase [Candidatus Parcubacteria bacterium]